MAAPSYIKLQGGSDGKRTPVGDLVDIDLNVDDIDTRSPSILSPPPADDDEQIEMKISSPPTSSQEIKSKKRSGLKGRRRRRSSLYINMKLKNITKLFDYQQIYFGCIAPLRHNYIDLHCNDLSDLDLSYCCGLYMKIDRSFTIHTILSTEFITSLKKIILKKENVLNDKKKKILNEPNDVELKINEKKHRDKLYVDDYKASNFVAFHPRDHWEFAKDMEHKNCIIFVHGQNYAPDKINAAQFIMNECINFYADMPYLVIPFIWPCEGELLEYDTSVIAEEYCGTELATFIRRLWSLFERIDFVGHGKGCNILMRALKLLKKDKPDVIDMSHVVLIAADIDYTIFLEEYLNPIYSFVKRITIYVNTWDWKLYSSKMWNWSSDRIGAVVLSSNDRKKFDCIDVTQLLSGWFLTSNHYYLTNKYFKLDIIQSLSKIGGVDPKYRNYVLPVYDDSNITSSLLSSGSNNVKYYELVDKPYMKIVPEQKQNENINVENIENKENNNDIIDDDKKDEGDTKQSVDEDDVDNEEKQKQQIFNDMNTVTKNLQVLGYVDDDEEEEEEQDENNETKIVNNNNNDDVIIDEENQIKQNDVEVEIR